jgi:ParB family chromosome partitioning protein
MAEPKGITKRSNAFFVDPKAIERREGWNPRFDFGDIHELKKSIKANGVLVPLRLKRAGEGRFILVDGDRRFTAIQELMKEKHQFKDGVPAILLPQDSTDVENLIQMFEANTGKPFLPLEEAAAFQKLRDAGLTVKQISDRVGRSHVHIEQGLSLLHADDSVKEAVKTGKVSATLGKKIATKVKGNAAAQKAAVAKATSGKAGKEEVTREMEKIRRRKPSAKEAASPKLVPPTKATLDTLETKLMAQITPLLKSNHLQNTSAAERVEAIKSDIDKVDQELAYLQGVLLGIQFARGLDIGVDL